MVTTRAQSNHLLKRGGPSPSYASVHSHSSGGGSGSGSDDDGGGGDGEGHRRGEKRRSTPPKDVSAAERRQHSNVARLQREASRASGVASSEGMELLGRGHRISRPTHTLDEEYIAISYYGDEGGGGRRNGAKGRPHRSGSAEGEAVVHERYPPRAAAQRALFRLQHTLHEQDRDAVSSSSSSSPSSRSSSPGRSTSKYTFRHHPEIGERMNKAGGSARLPPSSSSSSSDEEEGEGWVGRKGTARRGGGGEEHGRNRAAGGSLGHRGPNGTGGNGPSNGKRGRASSIDSSISNESMREASIEELARQDAKEHRRQTGGGGSASDSDSTEDDGAVTERDLKRAMRSAKESTARNVNINHYLHDAVGEVDERKARRRRIDRRYRHLFALDEEEKERQSGGGGGGGGGGDGGGGGSTTANGALGDISPLKVDGSVSFDSVGGLPAHIVALREMVLLPLLYPQLLKSMRLSAPRGVLFVGPPGTGKTLMARALAVEGSRCSERKVTFFMRKGADILSKWVGESERQLKLLFTEARRLQPSIIFFDEIDGLAPTRHTKTEQTQAALVATLLALLDGLEDRGQVVVIGATNRPDTIDPALRRPGRFDRELVFPLPDTAARRHVLSILTAKQTLADPAGKADLMEELVSHTEGYSGADLQALCMEAGLNRLRTALPQLYTTSKKLVLPYSPSASPSQLAIRKEDFFAAARRIHPSMQRGGQELHLTQMDEHLEKLFHGARGSILTALSQVYVPVAHALAKERRDCRDLSSAVRQLSSVPIPHTRHAAIVFLQVGDGDADSDADAAAADADAKQQQPQQQQRGDPADPLRTPSRAARAAGESKSRSKSTSRSLPSKPPGAEPLCFAPTATAKCGAANTVAAKQMVLMNAAVATIRGLPMFPALSVHLPHVRVTFAAADGPTGFGDGREAALGGSAFAGGHMYQLVQAVQRCSPCTVLLRGAEEWLRDQGLPLTNDDDDDDDSDDDDNDDDDSCVNSTLCLSGEELEERRGRMAAMRYYLNLLADTEAIILVPCSSDRTRQALLGGRSTRSAGPRPPLEWVCRRDGVATHRVSTSQHQQHPHFVVLRSLVQPFPTPDDLRRFVVHVYRTVALTLRVQAVMAVRTSSAGLAEGGSLSPPALAVDTSPTQPEPPSKLERRAQHRQAVELWRKVEYRRLQLRHVLLKWVSQFVNSGRFKLLLSADLDLPPESPTYKEWRRHTRGTRIGLDDILDRLEREAYVCLSQFHDDIDMLVRNVRSFFRSRAQMDQRYRMKALELKEATVLNMYKLSRSVVRFCEMHRDVVEPPPLPSDGKEADSDEDSEHTGLLAEDRDKEDGGHSTSLGALRFHQRPSGPTRPRRKFRVFGQRRRRRRAPVAAAKHEGSPQPEKRSTDGKPPERTESEEEEEEAVVEGVVRRSTSAPKSAGNSDSSHCSMEEEKEREKEETAPPTGSPFLPLAVEAWAVALLCGWTHCELHQVFQLVMQQLDAEVQRRDAGVSASPPAAGPVGEGDSPQPRPVASPAAAARAKGDGSDGKQSASSRSSGGGVTSKPGRCKVVTEPSEALPNTAPPSPRLSPEEGDDGEEGPKVLFTRMLSAAVAKVRSLQGAL